MKTMTTSRWLAILGATILACQAYAGESQPLKTQKEKVGYTIGVDTARVLRQQEIEVDLDTLIQGLKDGMSDEKLLMTDQDLLATRNETQKELVRKQAAKKQNRSRGQAPKKSAEDNKKEGVVTLPASR